MEAHSSPNQALPAAWWESYLAALVQNTGARTALLLIRSAAGWTPQMVAPAGAEALWQDAQAQGELERLACEAAIEGAVIRRYSRGGAPLHLIVSRLPAPGAEGAVALRLESTEDAAALEIARRVRLEAEAPLFHALQEAHAQRAREAAQFAHILQLLLQLNSERHFVSAAMLLCNGVAARCGAVRASFGWRENGRVRLQAISHGERFDRRAETVRAMEAAMDEALEQDTDIAWPGDTSARLVTRDHAACAEQEKCAALGTLVLRLGEEPAAVLLIEKAAPFSAGEWQELRLLGDQTPWRLEELRRRDQWFGLRWRAAWQAQASAWLGVEHTGAKLLALGGAALLAFLALARLPYRVDAPFALKSDAVAELPAPYDGYIEQVRYRIGDHVTQGAPLVTLETKELLVQEAAAIAEKQRRLAEMQKAESDQNVADSRIAAAAADEAEARLAILRLHLSQATLKAPFEGYVVAGDLREKIAAPVKQGDVLLQVAKIDALYPELRVPETSIALLRAPAQAALAFASRPKRTFLARLETIQPLAEPSEKGSVFIIRGRFLGSREDWWRPGMTGSARVEAASRSPLWILTHRTVDVLRLRFWW